MEMQKKITVRASLQELLAYRSGHVARPDMFFCPATGEEFSREAVLRGGSRGVDCSWQSVTMRKVSTGGALPEWWSR